MNKKIIGMIHLWKIRWIKNHELKEVIKKWIYDLLQLEEGGIQYACLINESDIPYTITISDQERDTFLEIAKEIQKIAKIKLWICVLYNDWKATLDIAKAIHANFVRIDTFVDLVESDAGIIYPQANEIKRYQKEIWAENIELLTDIHPKYKKMIEEKTLYDSANQAFKSWSNWIIVTWKCSWDVACLNEIKNLREKLWKGKIYLWSWASSDNIRDYFKYVDGAFVWTSLKKNWSVDKEKVIELINNCK